MTTTFHEHEHPRGHGGQFTVKPKGEATGVDLACDAAAMTDQPDTFEMLWCESCEKAFDESEAVRLYECQNCNTTSAERRCDQCNRFRSRSEAPGCPECEEPVEGDPVVMVHDHDGAAIRIEDYEPDGPTLAEREEQAKIAAAAQAEADRAARLAAKQENTGFVTAAAIEPGMVLINPDDDSRFATEAEVLSTRHVDTPDGPIVIFKTFEYGPRTVVRRADADIPVQAVVEDPPTVQRDGTRLTADDFGGARFVDGFDPKMDHVSSPSNAIEVQVGSTSRDGGTLPALALMLGRRASNGKIGGMVSFIGRWDDPEKASAALDEMERAADAFAVARVEHPPVREDEDDAAERREKPADWQAVSSREVDWITGDESRSISMRIGMPSSSWEAEKGALLAFRTDGGGLNSSLDDPAVLKTAVAEARKHLHTLTGIPNRPDVVDDKI